MLKLIKENIEQPYVLVIGFILFLASIIFLVMPMGEEPPFLFTVAIITGLATKATISFQLGSPNIALCLFVMALALIGITALETDVTAFSDAAWKSLMSGVAGLGVVLLGEAQSRR